MMRRNYAYWGLCVCLFVALTGCSSPTENKPVAEVSDAIEVPEGQTTDATAEEAIASGPRTGYEFTKNTYVGFAGSKSAAGITLGTHYGQFLSYDGGVSTVEGSLEDVRIKIDFDMTKANTDNSILTGTLKDEHFFNVTEHPTASFESTSVVAKGDGYEVTGNLELVGVTKSVTFPATIALDGTMLKAQAEFSLDRTAWGIGEGYVMSDQIVDKAVLMELDIEAKPMSADQFSQAQEGSRPK